MRAAVLRAHGSVPVHTDHPDPVADDDSVLVRVTAAPVVPLDLLCASGTSYFGSRSLPYVPGVQGVGEVASGPEAGAAVFFATSAGMADGDGSFADLCVVPARDVVPIETDLAPTTVAALGLSAIAAWQALGRRAALQPGEQVVVLGAGGAVGQAAIGAARVMGASRVVAVCRPGDAVDRAAACDADSVVALPENQDADRLVSELGDVLAGEADVVLDPVFGWVASAAARVIAPGGRLVNLGGSAGDAATFSSAGLRGRSISVLGYTNNSLTSQQRADALGSVLRHAAEGRISVAHDVRPLAEVSVAWRALADGRTGRRTVLTP